MILNHVSDSGTSNAPRLRCGEFHSGMVTSICIYNMYICSAQSENRYNSGIVLRKEGILTLWFNSRIVPVQF